MGTDREGRVRERAYAVWEREGRPEGGAERHWAQAEEELRAEGARLAEEEAGIGPDTCTTGGMLP